jgi:predicted  nucleic acid-binding Zn-ribbon protein
MKGEGSIDDEAKNRLLSMANRYVRKGMKGSVADQSAYSKAVELGLITPADVAEDSDSSQNDLAESGTSQPSVKPSERVTITYTEYQALNETARRVLDVQGTLKARDAEIEALKERLSGLEESVMGIRPSQAPVILGEDDVVDAKQPEAKRPKHDTLIDHPAIEVGGDESVDGRLRQYEHDLAEAGEEIESLKSANTTLIGDKEGLTGRIESLTSEIGEARTALLDSEEARALAEENLAATEKNLVAPDEEGRRLGAAFRKHELLYDEIDRTRVLLTDLFMKARHHKEGEDAANKELRISRFSLEAVGEIRKGKLETAQEEIERYLEEIDLLQETVTEVEESGADAAMAWAEALDNFEMEQVTSTGRLFLIDHMMDKLRLRELQLSSVQSSSLPHRQRSERSSSQR